MATTYTGNYQLKKIGTGEEASTWGVSTNVNWAKIEQIVGGGSVVGLSDASASSTWTKAGNTLTWVTSNTAAAGAENSKGRSKFVTFTDGSESAGAKPDAMATVDICGDTSSLTVERVFFVRNNLGSGYDIKFISGTPGGTVIVKGWISLGYSSYAPGACAVLYVDGANSVTNILDTLMVNAISFEDGSGEIILEDDVADALEVKNGTAVALKFDTTDDAEKVVIGDAMFDVLDLNVETVDISTQPTVLKLNNSEAAAFSITDSADPDKTAMAVDTVDNKIVFGDDSFTKLELKTATIDSLSQVQEWHLKLDTLAALDIKDGTSTSFVKFDTKDSLDANTVTITGDLAVTGEVSWGGASVPATTFEDTVTINAVNVLDFGQVAGATNILMRDDESFGLDIKEGSNSYIRCDTTDDAQRVVIGSGGNLTSFRIEAPTINIGAQTTDIDLKDDEEFALKIDTAGQNMLTFDTTDDAEVISSPVELNLTKAAGCLNVGGTSDFSAQATFTAGVNIDGAGNIDEVVIGANTPAAITGTTVTSGVLDATGVFSSNGDGDVQLKTGNSDTGTITITDGADGAIALAPHGDGVVTVATDLQVLTTDGYLNFGATAGTGGIGIRNNAGTVEAKLKSADAWGPIYSSGAASGGGTYFQSTPEELDAAGGEYYEALHGFVTATSVLPTNPFAGGAADIVTVTDTGHHGVVALDSVAFSGVSGDPLGIANAVWNRAQGFTVVTLLDANSYTIDMGETATAGPAGGSSIPASYGAIPRIVTGSMQCVVEDSSLYSVGDEIVFAAPGQADGGRGILPGANGTHVFAQAGSYSSFWFILKKGTGAQVEGVTENWRLILRAWK